MSESVQANRLRSPAVEGTRSQGMCLGHCCKKCAYTSKLLSFCDFFPTRTLGLLVVSCTKWLWEYQSLRV